MKILSIETSCDESAISILEAESLPADKQGEFNNVTFKILADNLISQIEIHKEYGGVFPALAKREHSKNLIPILRKTLTDAKLGNSTAKSKDTWTPGVQVEKVEEILEREPELLKLFMEYIPTIEIPEIDAIAVTQGPGLEPALWVGINFAKALSLVWDKPLIPVNHMEGHLLASLGNSESEEIKFPAIGLLVSGGHTELILMNKIGSYEKIGQTRDDAVGEAFDKVARMMDLPYPGGPEISKLAQLQREIRTPTTNSYSDYENIKLPRPMINTDDFDFSFSGLKTSVLYLIKNIKKELSNESLDRVAVAREDERDKSRSYEEKISSSTDFAKQNPSLQIQDESLKKHSNEIELPQEIKQQIALEFEKAVTEILIKKTQKAIEKYGAKTLILGGGVTANNHIRESFKNLEKESDIKVLIPEKELSTDNSVMIGIAGYFEYLKQKEKGQLLKATDLEGLRADGNLRL
ncbi:tRNA (adenosine(37)-N6)-threonylcarbamoyltransferase complex transferase subunit TsaD [Patescibacteria group bacterium]|nr:tRNA (adenosine(37)-N6)-threonylcarbamoyltransferase complex transferase subunit TsaD [Patescibacteria group bacterium]